MALCKVITGTIMKSIDLASVLEEEEERRRSWRESDPGANLARAIYEAGQNFIGAKMPQPLRVMGDLSVLVAERLAKNDGLVAAIDWYKQAFFAYHFALDADNAQSEEPSQKIYGFAEYLRGQMQVANGRLPWNYQPKSPEEFVLGQANLHPGLDFMEVIDAAESTYRDNGEDFLGLGGLGEVLEEAAKKMLSRGIDIATVEVILD